MSVSSTDSTEIRIAGIARDSIVDGEGIRLTVFTQGCPRRCPGCHNPDTQPTDGGRVTTLSGGEPFLQPAALLPLARAAHERGLDVWSYTGYTLEELRAQKNPDVDALLDELALINREVNGMIYLGGQVAGSAETVAAPALEVIEPEDEAVEPVAEEETEAAPAKESMPDKATEDTADKKGSTKKGSTKKGSTKKNSTDTKGKK